MTEWLVPVDNGDAVLQAGGCSCIVPRFQSTINCCPLIARSDARYIVDVLPSVDTGYGVVWTFGLVAPPEVGRRRNFEERARCYFFMLGWEDPLPHCVFLCFARRSGSPSSVLLCVSEQAHGGTIGGPFIAQRLKVANKHPTTSENGKVE